MSLKSKVCLFVAAATFIPSVSASYVHDFGPGDQSQNQRMYKISAVTSVSSKESSRPNIGGGFYNDFDLFTTDNCINGEGVIDNSGDTSGSISFDYQSNLVKTFNDRRLKVDGNATYGGFDAEASYSAHSQASNTTSSSTIIYRQSYEAPVVRFALDNNDPNILNLEAAAALAAGVKQFYSKYGTSYINELQRGGVFNLIIKLDFSNSSLKNKYETEFGASYFDFASLEASLIEIQDKYATNLRVYITANQIGGDASMLGEVLNAVDGDSVKECTKNECIDLLKGVRNYLQKDSSMAVSWRENPAILGIHTRSYNDVIPTLPQIISELDVDIIGARVDIHNALLMQYSKLNEVKVVLSNNANNSIVQKRWDALDQAYEELKVKVESNIFDLEAAHSNCFSTLSQCINSAVNTIANLNVIEYPQSPSAVYDIGVIDIARGGYETFCSAPYSSVLVGFGARASKGDIKGVRIGYRLLNSAGSLGSIQVKQCGQGYERYVQVPDGHVLTGVQARVRKNDVAAINAFSKRWDSSIRELTGNVVSTASGTGYEMTLDLSEPGLSGHPLDTDHVALTGVGFRDSSDDISGISGKVGWMD